jgi:hypothetical protein
MNTKVWYDCFCKIEAAQTEEELKEATQELLQNYTIFLENLLKENGI